MSPSPKNTRPLTGDSAAPGQVFLSGFAFQPASPYHHGARSLPSPSSSSTPLSLPRSGVLADISSGARSRPDLSACRPVWLAQLQKLEALGADPSFVSEMYSHISFGVSPGLASRPTPASFPNSHSVRANKAFVRQELDEFVTLSFLRSLSAPPPLCHPLLVVTKPGKKPRLCLDLSRNFNDQVAKRKFKLLSLEAAVAWSEPGCWYGKMDLSSCFLSFPMHPDAARDLAFAFDGKFFQFDVMPFGLSSAPRIASSLLDIVSAQLHDEGLRVIRYRPRGGRGATGLTRRLRSRQHV